MEKSEAELLNLALEVLKKYGDEGVTQDKFIEELGIDSKEAIKLLSKLTKKGILKKETRKIDSKKVTYLRLFESNLKIPVSLEFLSQIPCFKCKYLLVCKPGSNPNPADCTILDEWLEKLASK